MFPSAKSSPLKRADESVRDRLPESRLSKLEDALLEQTETCPSGRAVDRLLKRALESILETGVLCAQLERIRLVPGTIDSRKSSLLKNFQGWILSTKRDSFCVNH